MKRLLLVLALVSTIATAHSATYRGRVQYARSDRPAAGLIVAAVSLSPPNLLFLVPQEPYSVVSHTKTKADGTFSLDVPKLSPRLRIIALGTFHGWSGTGFDRRIIPQVDRFNVLTIPEDFRPARPSWPPFRKLPPK
jgi:hypothetical protein